ncbi:hypothetical protein JTB14_029122 [Gonioctena quinquepunctata]|nr:hypothetical protein JTB14_029122 [Gonioctena quinquepunctata]
MNTKQDIFNVSVNDTSLQLKFFIIKNLVTNNLLKYQQKLEKFAFSNLMETILRVAKLHVYRVDPFLEVSELKQLTKSHFLEAKRKVIEYEYPELYAPFKVNIYEKNFEAAIDPNELPVEAHVRKFVDLSQNFTKV